MATQYTPILQLALPVTGELNGTWGDVVNDNITSMVEQAIAGLATINTWTANSHTLTTANGTTDEARCAMLVAATGSGGTAITGNGEIICPARTKLFVLQNTTLFTVTLKTASGTGIAVATGETAFLFCDGTNVNACVTTIINGHVTGNLTVDGNATIKGNTTLGDATSDTITATARIASDLNPSADNTYDLGTAGNSWRNLYIDGTATIATLNVTTIDTTNLEVTNIKAKDGTAAITLADSTGVASFTANPVLSGGTANGVVYLNGSKSATSGTALYFDGTNLAVGTTTPVSKFHVNTNSATATYSTTGNLTNGVLIGVTSAGTPQILNYAGVGMQFGGSYGSGSPTIQMVLDTSGNLGLGVTPPTVSTGKSISVGFSGSNIWSATTSGNIFILSNAYYNGGYKYDITGAASYYQQNAGIHSWYNAPSGTAGNAITFTQAMTLDASGNLGVGATSPTAYSGYATVALNGTNGGLLEFQKAGVQQSYISNAGSQSLQFSTAGSERMRIDSSGNVLVGASSVAGGTVKLGVIGRGFVGNSDPTYILDGNDNLTVYSSSGNPCQIRTWISGTASSLYGHKSGDSNLYITNTYAGNALGSNGIAINSSGNVGVGTASPNVILQVGDGTGTRIVAVDGGSSTAQGGVYAVRQGGTYKGAFGTYAVQVGSGTTADMMIQSYLDNFIVRTAAAKYIRFDTNSTERMVISSGGFVGVGTSTPSVTLEVSGSARFGSSNGVVSGGYGVEMRTTTNWNYAGLNVIRNSSNTSSPRFIGMPLDGDDLASTTIGAYNAIWGSYDSAPTTGSTSSALNGAMVYGAYAGHRWVVNGTEMLRIDSTGRLIAGNAGTSTIEYSFAGQEVKTGMGCPTDGTLAFYAGSSSERVRVDSGGNVKLSTAGTSILNSSGRKILNQTGSILQVVSTAYSTGFTTSATTPQATGLSVAITPASTSSKVLVTVTANGRATATTGNCYVECWLYRNGTSIWTGFAQAGNFGSTDLRGMIGIQFLDSPATTSSTTYQLYIGSNFGTSVSINQSSGTSTITAMEISA